MAKTSSPDTEAMRLSVERGSGFAAGPRAHAWPAMVLPLEVSVIELRVGAGPAQRLDRTQLALVPAGVTHHVRALSPVPQLLTLHVGEAAKARACREYRGHVLAEQFDEFVLSPRTLTRTRWVDELAHRYVFEREVCEKHASLAARFLETELAKELYFLCKESEAQETRASHVYEGSDIVRRGREWIEQHLFEALRVATLARHCRASESTLLRAFQRELGVSPVTYLRQRRLDEALLLLRSGRLTVGEVAMRVGYASVGAFTTAFHRRFGEPPKAVRQAPHAPTLPPHGQPPRRARKRR